MQKYLYCIIILLNCFSLTVHAQTLELVKEISTGNSNPYNFTAAAGKLFFVAKDDANQFKLYVTEGTAATTQLLGPAAGLNGTIYSMIAYNNKLFFTCKDGVNGQELWTSDGTVAGTVLFKDLYPGPTGSFPSAFTVANGKLFFMGNGVDGERRLYVSDGTAAGTIIIRNNYINLFNGFSDFAVMNNEIYFTGDGAPLYPYGLWKSDGTLAGTVLVKAAGGFSPGVLGSNYAVLNNKMYFSGYDNINGGELWVTDGTDAGTHIVINLRTDGGGVLYSGTPMALTVYNSKIYFSAADDTHGQELFMTDGTAAGTVLVKDMLPGPTGSVPYEITIHNGLLYILNNYNREMWKSDGTTTGTQLVTMAPEQSRFGAVWNDKIYIISNTGQYLWQTDGTAVGTVYATASNTTALIRISNTDRNLIPYNSNLYFGGSSDVISPTTEPLRLVAAVVTNYSFTGNGNWSNPANWAGGIVPPSTLPAGYTVVITGNCVLDIAVTAQTGSSVTVAAGGTLVIPASLTIL